MVERFSPNIEGGKEFILSEKINKPESPSQKNKARDFLYDSKKQEIINFVTAKSGEKKEKRHPFQEFLYALREEEVKASTSEWIDLQKVLAEGEVQSLDDLYIVARATLVKDVTDYPKFDTVFGRMFYDIEPPKEEENEQETEEEPEPEPEQEQEEEEHEMEDNQSQEIVDPGFTENNHGGDDVHKAIKNSKSSGNEVDAELKENDKKEEDVKQENRYEKKTEKNSVEDKKKERNGSGDKSKEKNRNKKEIIIEGKGGYSAREKVVKREYDKFDKEQIINYESFGKVFSKLTSIILETGQIPTGKLDSEATVKNIAKNAGLPELILREDIEDKPKVILLFDVGGSTDEFRPIMEKLFAAAKDYLDDIEVYYFHNAIYGEVWPQKDGNYGKNFIPFDKIIKKEPNSKVIVIGDAWMAEDELFNNDFDEKGVRCKSGIENFKRLKESFEHSVWINPIPEREHDLMDNSGTIAEIKNVFSMYDMTLGGLERAVRELMEE